MKVLIFSIRVAIVAVGVSAGFRTLHSEAANHNNLPDTTQQIWQRNRVSAIDRVVHIDASSGSCANPKPDDMKGCVELEQRILSSTVRIEWNLWIKESDDDGYSRVDRVAHGTVKQGRYLVTHNHSKVLLSDMKNKEFNRISIFTADGAPIWPKGPLNTITIIAQSEETLVLDFGDYSGQGFFEMLGVPSAEFRSWESLPLQAGAEVAQIVWDGETAYVDWVTIEDVVTGSGVPRLELDNLVTKGTSGGGVFWNGYHIANTWYQAYAIDANGVTISRHYSAAALNSPQVAARFQ